MRKSFLLSYLAELASLIAAFIAIFGADRLAPLSSDGRLGILVISSFAAIFFAENLYLKTRVNRKGRYADSLELINSGFRSIHTANSNAAPTKEGIENALQNLCTNIAEAFTVITGVRCAACIKIIQQEDAAIDIRNVHVETLCRDSHSEADRMEPSDVDFIVSENTAFREIFEQIAQPGQPHFYSNNLPRLHGYENGSFELRGGRPRERTWILRALRWRLPYRSTIVVPICPCDPAKQVTGSINGFFCVDSKFMWVFRKRYDLIMMRGVADGLYKLIHKYKTIS